MMDRPFDLFWQSSVELSVIANIWMSRSLNMRHFLWDHMFYRLPVRVVGAGLTYNMSNTINRLSSTCSKEYSINTLTTIPTPCIAYMHYNLKKDAVHIFILHVSYNLAYTSYMRQSREIPHIWSILARRFLYCNLG